MSDDRMPVLVGVGQVTEKEPDLDNVSSPVDLMVQAVELAVEDAHLAKSALAELDVLVVVKAFREATRNSPEAVADRIGAARARQWLMPDGGNGPQYLVNRYSEAIANGELDFALFTGSEAIDSARRLLKAGRELPWQLPSDRDPDFLVPDKPMTSDHERANGILLPAHVYPLYENGLRRHYGRSIEAHQRALGELFAPFTEVAAKTPHAWFPVARSAEEIATATPSNRYVGWPYTKFMNAMNQINQSAALLLMSVAKARALGVPEEKWLYLHGCADASELWYVSERRDYHSSPAISVMARETLGMADRSMDDVAHIDLYSCFPSAVQIARDAFGIPADDPRPLTVTGGLPFHGGAGNNYVMNSIATMAEKLRADRGAFGLVTANGGYLTKHAAGLYSTTPVEGPWKRRDPAEYQVEIDGEARPERAEAPEGEGTIETYTVTFGREGTPERGIVVGRLGPDGPASGPEVRRFVAFAPDDPALLQAMTTEDFLGRRGRVAPDGKSNRFTPAA